MLVAWLRGEPTTSEPSRVLLEVDPQAAHRVVDGGEDLHRVLVRIDADELLVDLEDARELLAQERPSSLCVRSR